MIKKLWRLSKTWKINDAIKEKERQAKEEARAAAVEYRKHAARQDERG